MEARLEDGTSVEMFPVACSELRYLDARWLEGECRIRTGFVVLFVRIPCVLEVILGRGLLHASDRALVLVQNSCRLVMRVGAPRLCRSSVVALALRVQVSGVALM